MLKTAEGGMKDNCAFHDSCKTELTCDTGIFSAEVVKLFHCDLYDVGETRFLLSSSFLAGKFQP